MFEYEGRSVTFAELDARSNRLANAFTAAGVQAGDRVAFLDKNSVEFFEVVFALTKIGAVIVVLNWRLAGNEVAQIVNDAKAAVMIVGPEFVAEVEKIEPTLDTVSTFVAIGGHDRWRRYEEFLSAHDAVDPMVESRGGDVVLQLYTSGTTGLPKGVMLTNDNFFTGMEHIAPSWGLTPGSVNLAVMPMFHIAGSGWALTGLAQGCRTVLIRDVDPARILAAIPEFGVTTALFVPAVIQLLVSTPTRRPPTSRRCR